MSSLACLKRSYADTGLDEQYPNQITPTPSADTHAVASSQDVPLSPCPANLPMPTASIACPSTSNLTVQGPSTTTTEKPNKKVKLTYAEKEAEQIEKKFKEQQKAEEKIKKEEERQLKERQKAEEKRVKEAEKDERKKVREEQAKVKEAEKQKKLEEKQKAEEEKNKKARSQLRLNAFFVQPSMPNSTPRASPARDTASPSNSRRSSIAEINEMEISPEQSRTVSSMPRKAQLPDYERQFPPFFLQSHTVLAPYTRFSRDGKSLEYAQKKIDEGLGQGKEIHGSYNAHDLLHVSPHSTRHFPCVHAVKDIIASMHGSARNPIDLTESQSQRAAQKSADLLKTVPMKYLKFFEDYRPPYTGTFTKVKDRRSISKLCRKPFSRELPNTNYDYDSEAEWEEPGEGEDLDSEGEEEVGEDEEENDMEGFLDDENDVIKKRPLLGDLEPTCSGICWEDLENGDSKLENLDVLDLSRFKLDILLETPKLPIDPYSTAYWTPNAPPNIVNGSPYVNGMLMEPPRIPLNPINRQNHLLGPSAAGTTIKTASSDATAQIKPPKGPKRLIPPELLEEFKKAINGNDLTKLGLLEVLKKQFPKQPKAALRDTLDTFAERVGAKEAEKRWMLKSVPGL